ncbi:MAG TPA: oxygenase MpaB family protein [Verrucomicrobiales bacterium]|nr:oxygenase MpaB family protein [Verrucomicrobiales bacterium]
MFRSPVLAEIRTLDPARDHQRMTFLTCRVDFPWDITRALELALFRTYCIPSISELLDRTQEFQCRAQRRYDDTDIIVSEIMENGYDSERGLAAIRRMNQIHGRFEISNEDFLYVLSTFVYVPIRWIERFGWRKLIPAEKTALFLFWREVGRRMNIKDLPEDSAAFEAFSDAYEKKHYRFTETNRRVGTATRELFASWFPRVFSPLVRRSIHALLDDPLRESFGFPRPGAFLRTMVPLTMRMRARSLRLLPRRKKPVLRTEMKRPSHPCGYHLDRVGPEPPSQTG